VRVAFIATYAAWTPHFAVELELAQDHLDAGDEVVWVRCDGVLDACEPNPGHTRRICRRCRGKAAHGLSLLDGEVREIALSSLVPAQAARDVEGLPARFADTDDLKALEIDGLDAGWAGLSSTVWIHREADIDPNSDLVRRYAKASIRTYRATQRFIEAEAPDRVYVFNGRMAPMRGVLRACQEAGVECHVHERGRDIHHYAIFEDCMPHDIAPTIARIHRVWEESDLPEDEREAIGARWFDARVEGHGGSWVSFVEGQDRGRLPDDWDPSRRNVAFYTSSEYEYAAIGKEWTSELYGTPLQGVLGIAEEVSRRGKVHLTIRVHPNATAAKSRSVAQLRDLDLPHVTVVAPEDPVSTYDLMAAADVVVASGSTAGIEAVYRGKPSIQVSAGLSWGLGACHEPRTREELFRMLEDPDLEPGSKALAVRYGFYQATLGRPFRRFEPEGLFGGTFEGVKLRPGWTARRLSALDDVLDRLAPRAEPIPPPAAT